ncbi:hypothetical protein OIE62_08275 [Streptomyces scopuliridis]|uniref:Uncharacterized protein n=2 Tax=Streptomyces scopuliridis TaxID=452529 RepID=A0A2T7SXF5_9ACTN|nr:hypothetical protein [Streptomyces scopuliridis]PVE07586.1 hypothetical protein Y717_22375 [Streptomyces scopuliridis RB72]WSB37048.1 hypothetical protein OG949_32220 [Streptomyces scopuliridis]WSC01444.1 hypothetical protein OG835_33545 [Streptomyces scopuliridis]WSC05019.1 hypothetical protein OIE62_08275 [Streptomyces scopuliridis]
MSHAITSLLGSDAPAAGGRHLVIEDLDSMPEQGVALLSICINASPIAPAFNGHEQHQG